MTDTALAWLVAAPRRLLVYIILVVTVIVIVIIPLVNILHLLPGVNGPAIRTSTGRLVALVQITAFHALPLGWHSVHLHLA
jgi:hypothetical protein